MAIKHSETYFGQTALERFSGVLSRGLKRTPLLGVDVFFQLGNHDDIELCRIRSESLAKAVANGVIGQQSNIIAGQENNIISREGLMDFIVFSQLNVGIDKEICNLTTIEQGLDVGVYNNGEVVRTIKATPVVINYTAKYFTTEKVLVNEFTRQWLNWRFSDYVFNFKIDMQNPDGEYVHIPMSCQFDVSEDPQTDSVNRYANSLFFTTTASVKLHTLMLEEVKGYVIQSMNVNIYNDLPEPVLLETMVIENGN